VRILGFEIPDGGPVFLAALVVHVAAGLTAVVSGTVAAAARKRPGRHPGAGRVYLWALGAVFVTAAVMSALRWRENAHLFGIAVVASGLGLMGRRARRGGGRHWPRWHAIGMGGSFVALLTGFYVDNGSRLPLWDRLPPPAYWLLPAAVGVPVTWWAVRRFERRLSAARRAVAAAARRPTSPG
jgi:hypothetical protein